VFLAIEGALADAVRIAVVGKVCERVTDPSQLIDLVQQKRVNQARWRKKSVIVARPALATL
jgi:hypothetical protein